MYPGEDLDLAFDGPLNHVETSTVGRDVEGGVSRLPLHKIEIDLRVQQFKRYTSDVDQLQVESTRHCNRCEQYPASTIRSLIMTRCECYSHRYLLEYVILKRLNLN